MYDLLGPVLINGIFFSIILISVHNSAKFQLCSVIFAKSAVDTKIRLFFRYRALFFADTVAEKILVPISVTSVNRLSLFVLHHNYLSMCSSGKNLCSSGRNMDSWRWIMGRRGHISYLAYVRNPQSV
jgi:hypothetical protein